MFDLLIKKVANKADQQLDFKKLIGGIGGVVAEFIDGKIFEVALEYLVTVLPKDYHDEFELILNAYVSGDYQSLELESVQRVNQAIDIPGIDEMEEEIILKAIIGAFFKIVEYRKQKAL